MIDSKFSSPQNQELLGVVILFFKNAKRYANILLALVFGSIVSSHSAIWLGVAFVVGMVLMAVLSWFQYKRFLFFVDEDSLRIREGVFVREKITIPFERIQSVHLHQNLIQQMLGLTGIKVDTAGSGKKELEIHALSKSDALELQRLLKMGKEKCSTEDEKEEFTPQEEVKHSEEKLLVKLSIKQLLQVGITENHIKNGLVVIAAISGYFWQFEKFLEDYLDGMFQEYITLISSSLLIMGLFFAFLFVLGSVLISLIQVVLKYFNLRAFLTHDALHVNAGLLKRNEYTIPLNKIQFVEWSGNFLRRIPGFESVKILQGQSVEKSKQNVEIPACFEEQTQALMSALFDGGDSKYFKYPAHSFYRTFLMFVWTLIGLFFIGMASVITRDPWLLLMLLPYLAVVFIWVKRFVASIALRTNGEVMVYEKGWLFTTRIVLKSYKVQSVATSQSFFQRRRGTAHLTIHTAGGSRSIRFIDGQLAKEFHDFLLYKAESHQGSWM